MKRIFNENARALAMDMPDVHYIAIYGDLIAAKVQGRAASSCNTNHMLMLVKKIKFVFDIIFYCL